MNWGDLSLAIIMILGAVIIALVVPRPWSYMISFLLGAVGGWLAADITDRA